MFHPSEVELAETTQRILATSTGSSRRASCSTRCRSCGCWPATRCAIAGRSSRSSSSSPAAHCTVLLLDDMTRDRSRPAGAEHRARRDAARAAESRVRRRAAAAARRQVSRRAVPRRLPRLLDPTRRPRGVPAAGRGRASAGARSRDEARERHRRARRAARRRHRGGHQHADRRRRRHRQVDAGGAVRGGGRRARRARGAVHLRREPADAARALRRSWASISSGTSTRGT